MKHILIDGTCISCRIDGLSQYILNVVLNWELLPNYQYTLLLRPNQCPPTYMRLFREKGLYLDEVKIAPIGPKRDLQFALYLLKNRHFDAAFIPSNQFPLALHIPALYTIHDLIYEQFPEQLGRWNGLKRWYLRLVTRVGLRRAKQVVAVSQYTRSQILRRYGKNLDDKIQVVYEGWEHLLLHEKDKYELPQDVTFKNYILYVGSSRAHKNLSRLLEAIQQCHLQLPPEWGFLFIGSNTMLSNKQVQQIKEMNAKCQVVQFTGWKDASSLATYYRHAKALIFPSLSEGFGIPILEAYFYHLPLLLSNQASLSEVAGEAAIYFNPYDTNEIAQTILQFVQQSDHSDLIALQTQRLARYSWKYASNQLNVQIQQICKSI